jgi:hypothetical protein
VEIEEWNEYGELKQHVKIYYDEFTQPSISQAPKLPPVQPKPAVATAAAGASTAPANAPAAAAAAAVAAAAAQKARANEDENKAKPAVGDAAARMALPIRSIAEEAAAKAKQVRLQSLRDKVYGKGGTEDKPVGKAADTDGAADDEVQEAEPAAADESSSSLATTESAALTVKTAPGMQSPTTGTWKETSSSDLVPDGDPLQTLQSPTTTSWHPADVAPVITTYRGSIVASASAEDIAAVEQAEMIKEEPEEEEKEAAADAAAAAAAAAKS